jgi:hypothetical protein
MLVVLLAGIPPQTVIPTPLPVTSNSAPAVVAYFIFGLILISLTRYVNLETGWWQARLKVPAQIPRRWFVYSALILLVLVVVVGWLPTNYEIGLLGTFLSIMRLLNQLVFYLYGLILLFASLLSRLIGNAPPGSPDQTPAATPPPLLPTAAANPINWNLVKSVFLWGSLIIMAVIALRQYIEFHQDLSQDLKRFRPIQWLINAVKRFLTGFKKANQTVGKFIQDSLNRLRRPESGSVRPGEWDFINPRRLSPRQKVIFYYLALLRRAREAGIPRHADQTPYEYAGRLKSNLKEEKGAVDAMTEAFIEARYSRHTIPDKQANLAELIWANIRQVLRRERRSQREEKNHGS